MKNGITPVILLLPMVLYWIECTNPASGTATEKENEGTDIKFVKSDIPRHTTCKKEAMPVVNRYTG